MQTIEIKSKTDSNGYLKIDQKLSWADTDVRVLVLLEEEVKEQEDERAWVNSIWNNPAFDFLNEPGEDIYSLKDGEPLDD